MNLSTRVIIAVGCLLLCASGAIIANFSRGAFVNMNQNRALFEDLDFGSAYQSVVSDAPENFNFAKIESIIREEQTAISHRGRIEFGSVKVDGTNVNVHVLFVSPNGQMTPFLYTLKSSKHSWKIQSVQRIWFVPRAHLLRGLQV